MDNFIAKRGTVTFHPVHGTVLSGETGSRTELSVSGGGGYVGPRGGHVAAPQVHTSTTDVQSLWIRTDTGRDDHFSLVGTTAAVAVGQRVVMVLGKATNAADYWLVVLVNMNSQRYHPLVGITSLAALLNTPPNVLGPWCVGILSFAIGAWMMGTFDQYSPWHAVGILPLLFVPGICFVWLIVSRRQCVSRFKALQDRLARHVDTLGQSILASSGTHGAR